MCTLKFISCPPNVFRSCTAAFEEKNPSDVKKVVYYRHLEYINTINNIKGELLVIFFQKQIIINIIQFEKLQA